MLVDLSMNQLEAFVATAEQGSFAAAARQSGKSPSVVSSHISSLVRILGLTHFDRSTRSIFSVHAIARRENIHTTPEQDWALVNCGDYSG
jgi:DNA-binding transcriptional LysR family regulator